MLDPQAKTLLALIEQRNLAPFEALSPEEARRAYRDRRHFTQPAPPELPEVRELAADGPAGAIALRLYRPCATQHATARPTAADGPLPVLVYYHGGGWVIGDLDTHDVLCRQLAAQSGCALVAVDYRMAPGHRFPAAVDDCLAATRWVARQARSLGLDPARLAVGGDSAGGNLAAVVAIAARDAGDLPIRFQLLIYPATDQRRTGASHQANGKGYLLTSDTIAYFQDHYLGGAQHDSDWRASPLLHEDLARLPPALVLTAGYDPLRDEGLMYAQRLSESGNRATHLCFERQIHGFITMGKVIDEANEAVAICAGALARNLAD